MSKEYVRKATFTVGKSKNGTRTFTTRNKRARIMAQKLGHRLKPGRAVTLTLDEMKRTVGMGSYVPFAVGTNGTLSRLRF